MKIKPANPKGVKDLLPREMARRNYILDKLREIFSKYAYQNIQTPAFERLDTLMGKYGEDEKLLFKILNSGEYLHDETVQTLLKSEIYDAKEITPKIATKGLRYDLTVPLARYVAQHQNDLSFPFKRFQIGAVWRADRPQKGRFQEFTQCDIDIVGSKTNLHEIEILYIINDFIQEIGLKAKVHINDRKIFDAIGQLLKLDDSQKKQISILIDKKEKISAESYSNELTEILANEKDFEDNTKFNNFIDIMNSTTIDDLIQKGIPKEATESLQFILENAPNPELIQFDLHLVRGLDYYTGTVFELKPIDINIGSIGGGGRYDDLTSLFGLERMNGIGFSFGLERIEFCLDQKEIFEFKSSNMIRIIILHLIENTKELISLRKNILENASKNLIIDIYPEKSKLDKQFQYADKNKFDYALIYGDSEQKQGKINIKNLKTFQQETLNLDDLTKFINKNI
ncbi:MAG: histidine--tRNA ligase [Chitinophagales bacterium]|jgi:histidyl-tRNA synthetase|nr:histidine--tRNA ligase [Chitinophagales bacterium]